MKINKNQVVAVIRKAYKQGSIELYFDSTNSNDIRERVICGVLDVYGVGRIGGCFSGKRFFELSTDSWYHLREGKPASKLVTCSLVAMDATEVSNKPNAFSSFGN